MDAEEFLLAGNFVGFKFGDVVGDVVDEAEAEFWPGLVEEVGEGLADEVGENLSVSPGVVCGGAHGGEVALAFG